MSASRPASSGSVTPACHCCSRPATASSLSASERMSSSVARNAAGASLTIQSTTTRPGTRRAEAAAQVDAHPAGVRQRHRHDGLRAAVGDHGERVVHEVLLAEVARRRAGGAVTAPVEREHAASRAQQVDHGVEGGPRAAPPGQEEQRRVAEPLVVVVDDRVVRISPEA